MKIFQFYKQLLVIILSISIGFSPAFATLQCSAVAKNAEITTILREMKKDPALTKDMVDALIADGKSKMTPEGAETLRRLTEEHGSNLQKVLREIKLGRANKANIETLGKQLTEAVEVELARYQAKNNIFKEELPELSKVEADAINRSTLGQSAKKRLESYRLFQITKSIGTKAAGVTAAVSMLGLFFIGVSGVSSGVKMFGSSYVDAFFAATTNPIIGLFSGVLATTLLMSSSATTTLVVNLAAGTGAATGVLPVEAAIFMIMGANIGTAVTSTGIALGGRLSGTIKKGREFRDAFQAATVHDVFNLLTVGVLLPLEISTGFLAKTTAPIANALAGGQGGKFTSPLKTLIKEGVGAVKDIAHIIPNKLGTVLPESIISNIEATSVVVLSATLLYTGIFGLSKVINRNSVQDKLRSMFLKVKSPFAAISLGAVATTGVQSSSLITSLLVPIVGSGALAIETAFLVTMGSNLGTTSTALLASMGIGKEALQIALVHTMFNGVGTAMFLPQRMRAVPPLIAGKLASIADRHPIAATIAMLTVFVGVPAGAIAAERMSLDELVQQSLNNPPTQIEQMVQRR